MVIFLSPSPTNPEFENVIATVQTKGKEEETHEKKNVCISSIHLYEKGSNPFEESELVQQIWTIVG